MNENNIENTNKPFTINIDFDIAQKEWRKNKLYLGNGTFKYICGELTKKGSPCKNKPFSNGKCHIHMT